MKTDVRIVAATNVNMQKAISEGRFREDLFYRLNTIPIQMPPLRERGNDIVLLFRLFAMQMAEKFRLPRITLTDDAKEVLLQYKWPGNIRQLKNITEQMSVLSEKREIDAATIEQFIPRSPESTQLAVINTQGNHSYENERETLYKILNELSGNVRDLRREMNGLRQRIDDASEITSKAVELRTTLSPIDINTTKEHVANNRTANNTSVEYAEAEEVSEMENLNINDISRQIIEKALERNHGNRKKAANELGISDRTLYRKLKQYDLEKK